MKENVSDFLVRRLSEWGVKRIFGFPGDSINGMMGALNRAPQKNRFYPGAARGDGRIHGLCARQIHRRGRHLPDHLGPGRDSLAR
jgi:hypothetical protein